MRFLPWVPPAISPQAKTPSERRLRVLVDHEPTVLVVEDGVGVDRLRERVDPGSAVAPQHVGERDLRVGGGDAGRVEPDCGPAVVGVSRPCRLLDLSDDRR